MSGTLFQKSAWEAMLTIPYGQTISYAEEARRAGHPTALRAIGNANGRNPLAIIVPCHRVIASNGTIGGYSSGLDRKRFLLRLEGLASAE
jgi:methylated-DNA-[protein]-cysteine S-methyltransferase